MLVMRYITMLYQGTLLYTRHGRYSASPLCPDRRGGAFLVRVKARLLQTKNWEWQRAYLRVSTDRQGRSGLGLEAQRKAVDDFLKRRQVEADREFVEVESGKRDDRPWLAEALALCRLNNAVLVIAKLDRLSRDAHFLLGLQKAGVRFVAADIGAKPDCRLGSTFC